MTGRWRPGELGQVLGQKAGGERNKVREELRPPMPDVGNPQAGLQLSSGDPLHR